MITGGPKIETDGLILSFNASDYKSYKGESTTNILEYPEKISIRRRNNHNSRRFAFSRI